MAGFTNTAQLRQRTHRLPLHVYLYLTLHMVPYADTLAWQRLHEAFPEAQVVVEDMVVEGDTAAVRTSVHGIPSQQSPTMLEIFRVRDGRIAELWGLSSLRRA